MLTLLLAIGSLIGMIMLLAEVYANDESRIR